MLCEFSNNALQTINPNASAVFTETEVPCERGLILHRDGTGSFLAKGVVRNNIGCACGCKQNSRTAKYLVEFGANIAVPTGETVGEISVAIAINGTVIPSSQMIVTPAAVEEFSNVSNAKVVEIYAGCCETISIVNVSNVPILMQNANIVISRPDLYMTY